MTEQEPNVYAPPTAVDKTPSAVSGLARVRVPMPSPVLGAAAITGLYAAFAVVNGFNTVSQGGLGQAGVSILILIGIVRGSALAWQWGRLIPFITAIGSGAALAMLLTGTSEARSVSMVVVLCFSIAGSLALPILLSLESSKRYFGLACPNCGSLRSKADNFFFTTYRCRECKSTWR